MLITYSQMDKAGTRWMHVLGLPLYALTLYCSLAVADRGPAWFFGAPLVVGFVYTFLYSKLCAWFSAGRSVWWFLLSVVGVQLVIGVLLLAAA